MQIKDSGPARLFFALWPETSLQQALYALAMEYPLRGKARVMRAETLHMTLQFLGQVERARLPQVVAAAAGIALPPFGFMLEQLSFWQHNRIGYAAPAGAVPALDQLARALQKQLTDAGFQPETRGFNPHVTLLRNVGQGLETQAIKPLMWQVNAFVLMESVMTGREVRYQMLHSWPLVAAAAPC
ncbi:2'-5'-RNA ligase [mine drainage metagenome]|uniref:2'-5'-RNA ligase n=1 Tax=mine drainage metagenome TaxID=410659 RepID=A0A1J5QTB3_9ZZZZ